MSILNVNTIQPVGSGQTITVSATNISAPSTIVSASSFVGNVTGNVTGNLTGGSLSGISTAGITTLYTGGVQTTSNKIILASTGSVLKVASNSITGAVATTSGSLVGSGLITTMTPTNTNSNFFVILSHGRWGNAGANTGLVVNMYVSVNGGAYAATKSGNRNETLLYDGAGNAQGQHSYSDLYIPGVSVSTISFQPYFRIYNSGSNSFNITDTNGYGEPTLTVFEISA